MLISLGFYKKLPDMSDDEFLRHWNNHGDIVRKIPGYEKLLKKYVQHKIRPDPKSETELLYDGFSEAWFENEADRDEFLALAGEAGLFEHEKVFLDFNAKRWVVLDDPTVQV